MTTALSTLFGFAVTTLATISGGDVAGVTPPSGPHPVATGSAAIAAASAATRQRPAPNVLGFLTRPHGRQAG